MPEASQLTIASEIKISELPVGSEATDSDQLEANQGGTTRSITVGQIRAQLDGSVLTNPEMHGGSADQLALTQSTTDTPPPGDNSTRIANTAFVRDAVGQVATGPAGGDLAGNYPNPVIKSNVALSGTPTAPTASPQSFTGQIANTAYVAGELTVYAPLFSPALAGVPTAPTATGSSPNGVVVNKQFLSDTLNLVLPNYAPINSPTLTGVPKAPTPAGAAPSEQIATLGWVNGQIGSFNFAPLASPAFTGNPTAPTPATSDNDTTVATTAMVQAAIAAALGSIGVLPPGTVLDLVGSVLAPAGWVWAINGTIGNAASGATIRANADCANLFAHLWTLLDTEAPVSGGRGASAAADFAANKTIGGLDFRGVAKATFDSLGGTAAGRLTNLHPRNGMIAGAQTHALSTAELAVHTHTINDTHTHNMTQGGAGPTSYTGRAAFGDGVNAGLYSGVLTNNTTAITANNAGSGTAHNNTQSTRTVTTIIKL